MSQRSPEGRVPIDFSFVYERNSDNTEDKICIGTTQNWNLVLERGRKKPDFIDNHITAIWHVGGIDKFNWPFVTKMLAGVWNSDINLKGKQFVQESEAPLIVNAHQISKDPIVVPHLDDYSKKGFDRVLMNILGGSPYKLDFEVLTPLVQFSWIKAPVIDPNFEVDRIERFLIMRSNFNIYPFFAELYTDTRPFKDESNIQTLLVAQRFFIDYPHLTNGNTLN